MIGARNEINARDLSQCCNVDLCVATGDSQKRVWLFSKDFSDQTTTVCLSGCGDRAGVNHTKISRDFSINDRVSSRCKPAP